MLSLRCAIISIVVPALFGAAGCTSFRGAQLYQSGSVALDRGDTTQAISDLEQAASLVPDKSEVQNHLGIAYSQAGREDEAAQAFRRAVELDCSNQAAQENLRDFERRESEMP